jgi:hypothetical protein
MQTDNEGVFEADWAAYETAFENIYQDVREKLIALGVPPEEIAFIHDANTDVRKKELFAKVRKGQVRILIGSTEKMGAGTNVQDLIIASHDLDAPWRPRDLTQRGGRTKRQGNKNPRVYFFRYVTESTLNAYVSEVENGGLMDITDMISDNLKALIPDLALNAMKVKYRTYAIPNVQVMTNPLAVKAQKRLLEKYSFDWSKIQKIEDVEPFWEIIKKNEPDLYPYRTYWGAEPWVYPYYTLPGGTGTSNLLIKKDGNYKSFVLKYETEEYKRGYETFRDWYQKGYIRSDVASVGDDKTDARIGKCAVEIDTRKPSQEAVEAAGGIEYIYALLHKPFMQMTGPRATMTAVGANSKNPKLASLERGAAG